MEEGSAIQGKNTRKTLLFPVDTKTGFLGEIIFVIC
jgi:hypothetical protein